MKTALIIALIIFLPIWSAFFLVTYILLTPEIIEISPERLDRYCIEYYNSDPDITVEDDCNV